ncbi:hypothetical protein BC936DRAFT_144788 [Jimgerdemannia flammicorona]|uniref:Ricin B lectin domain-containing protein n=1 Tax=Jimgerdemannia flammicorona TaxID=994334 RepID=A0A433DBP1_9FUNG|nr:hypothetical protein BC936DRAFT_144788 [Jimgerdemannia flammicorona]
MEDVYTKPLQLCVHHLLGRTRPTRETFCILLYCSVPASRGENQNFPKATSTFAPAPVRCWTSKVEVTIYAGTYIIAYTKQQHHAENWVWHSEDGFLINKHSGLVLDIESGQLEADRRICQYHKHTKADYQDNQRFGYQDSYIYVLANPELVLHIRGAPHPR